MFGVSLDGPQPVIVLEYYAGGIKSNQTKSIRKLVTNFSFDCEENFILFLKFFD
jgi:hypothetical protein